jgi:hypothetical protein
MAPKDSTETNAAAQRRVTTEMRRLEQAIDKQETGPARLELLRRQADLGDEREALRSRRL